MAALDNINELADELLEENSSAAEESASEATADEAETSTLAVSEDAAPGESADEEKQ